MELLNLGNKKMDGPCFWVHDDFELRPAHHGFSYDFREWIMVSNVPTKMSATETMLLLGFPAGTQMRCTCDPHHVMFYRIIAVYENMVTALEERNRLHGTIFLGSKIIAISLHEMLAVVMQQERDAMAVMPGMPHKASIAVPDFSKRHLRYPIITLKELCRPYGEVVHVRRIVNADMAIPDMIVVTFSFMSQAIAAEFALNGFILDGVEVTVTCMADLERRRRALYALSARARLEGVPYNFTDLGTETDLVATGFIPNREVRGTKSPTKSIAEVQLAEAIMAGPSGIEVAHALEIADAPALERKPSTSTAKGFASTSGRITSTSPLASVAEKVEPISVAEGFAPVSGKMTGSSALPIVAEEVEPISVPEEFARASGRSTATSALPIVAEEVEPTPEAESVAVPGRRSDTPATDTIAAEEKESTSKDVEVAHATHSTSSVKETVPALKIRPTSEDKGVATTSKGITTTPTTVKVTPVDAGKGAAAVKASQPVEDMLHSLSLEKP